MGSPKAIAPAPGFDVVITEHEQGQDVTVRSGQGIEVFLRASPGMTDWGRITSSDQSILAPAAIYVMVPRGVTVAAFKAVSPGRTTITSYTSPACSPGQACPAYVILFSVRVTVLAT